MSCPSLSTAFSYYITLHPLTIGSAPGRTGAVDFTQLLERPRSSSAPTAHPNAHLAQMLPPPLTRSSSNGGLTGSDTTINGEHKSSPSNQSPVHTSPVRTSPNGITLNTTVQIIQVGKWL